tara:strand:+ start:288 stop:737 length:450 start_codon:yes stop_codon:yes gene_type:complete
MKQTLLIITAFMFITSTVIPQSKVNINNLVEYGGKMFKQDDDKPYTGRAFDLYKSTGEKKLEGRYRNGLRTGKWTYWYENGQKSEEGTLKDGLPDGLFTEWYENGQKSYESTFKDWKNGGLVTRWYNNGQKEREETYKDGKQIGKTKWY